MRFPSDPAVTPAEELRRTEMLLGADPTEEWVADAWAAMPAAPAEGLEHRPDSFDDVWYPTYRCDCPVHPCSRKRRKGRTKCSNCIEICG